MDIWSIADLHLSFGVPNKLMDVFGNHWKDHAQKIKSHWVDLVKPQDLVLLPGDISWALEPSEVLPDLAWIDQLPGTKLLLKGNHDYWWGSLKKVKEILPKSCHVIQNNSFIWNDIGIGGSRLWDAPTLNFDALLPIEQTKFSEGSSEGYLEESEKIYIRELSRLENSLKTLPSNVKNRIAMTHYPPVGPNLERTPASDLIKKYSMDICVFGHLHNISPNQTLFGTLDGTEYRLTACDYLDFSPKLILTL